MAALSHSQPSPTVRVEQGILVGDYYDGCFRFLGIPYATPPIGPLRWQYPLPPLSWEGKRDAKSFGPSAIQTVSTGLPPHIVTSEDCLYLNIWTKRLEASAKQPVMVWINGGGFLNGSSAVPMYHGGLLAQHGVTFVSINYRLGAFGFLRHPEIGGNFAALDWVAALSWISKNITAFGGDMGNVTIFGQSAGASATRALLSMPTAKGLFHRAIIQSSGYEPYVAALNPSLARVSMASEHVMGLLGTRNLDELRALPTEDVRVASLMASGLSPEPDQLHTPANLQWYPVPDGDIISEDLEPWVSHIAVLFGATSDEMRGFYRPNFVYGHPNVPLTEAYSMPMLKRMIKVLGGRNASQIERFYIEQKIPAHEALNELGTVAIWWEPALAMYDRLAGIPNLKAYYYRFTCFALYLGQ